MAHRAERAGFSPLEISDHEKDGRCFCYRCQTFHPATEFGVDNSRMDRTAGSCRQSLNAAARKARR